MGGVYMLQRRRRLEVDFRNLSEDNVDDALLACTPEEMMSDLSFKEGLKVRGEWLLHRFRTVGPCCKIAYVKNVPVGMIQFNPMHSIPYFVTNRSDALYIHCIFVKKVFREKGIGFNLLQSLINEMKKPNPYFREQPCRVLVTTARQRQAFRQPSYFRLKGFSQTQGNVDAGLVYWLFKEKHGEYVSVSSSEPLKVEEKGVKIFYDPCCQWCIFINETTKNLVNEIKPSTATQELDIWKDSKEALRRGVTSRTTYVNGRPVHFKDSEQFREGVRKALLMEQE
jgi:GNAT superfamily N-acetyltransferase/glutaredoxin